ncbi:HK97 family phage prohead protease [Leadbettera azotonutricia]|uniref:Caudovirus prohead protease n=1 Tax=Leadbettera azotonutricia (strain ATCC BAA-888 / DSM 13862 / ZAS-9) TaxID=545695 RepID=F5YB98_LEAAZ|nr:HK97 family phage prohead protease [Leadbettera azotonutricia]AEF80521.1 caudovirus prohead protease [Leadbettera azotonutricia ZAS-9]
MLIRYKSGEFKELDGKGILQFLGVTPEGQTVKVPSDIELIAPVPFALSGGNFVGCSDGEGGGGVPWVFSSFDLDRMGERIDPSGWDFSCYLKNPVIQWAHCFDIPAIGRAENIVADEKGLRGIIIFNGKEFDPFGWGIGERVKAGVIRAGSVGFRPIEIEIPSKKDGEDGTSLIFRKQELLEFSVCNVPANPYALATARHKEISNRKSSSDFWGGFIQKC